MRNTLLSQRNWRSPSNSCITRTFGAILYMAHSNICIEFLLIETHKRTTFTRTNYDLFKEIHTVNTLYERTYSKDHLEDKTALKVHCRTVWPTSTFRSAKAYRKGETSASGRRPEAREKLRCSGLRFSGLPRFADRAE